MAVWRYININRKRPSHTGLIATQFCSRSLNSADDALDCYGARQSVSQHLGRLRQDRPLMLVEKVEHQADLVGEFKRPPVPAVE